MTIAIDSTYVPVLDVDRAERYWRDQLATFVAPTPLGVDRAASVPGVADVTGERSRTLSVSLDRLQEYADRHGVTSKAVVQSAWALLLSRYSGCDDVLFGVAELDVRDDLPRVDSAVGRRLNVLPLRVPVDQGCVVGVWLRDVHERYCALRDYRWTSIADVRKWSRVPEAMALFDSVVGFEVRSTHATTKALRSSMLMPIDGKQIEQAHYPLVLGFRAARSLSLTVLYDTARFEAAAIERMADHLECVLEAMVEGGTGRVADLPTVRGEERRRLVDEWNATRREYGRDQCVHELFEARARTQPDSIAVVCGEALLTFAEANARANRLANYLQARGVGRGAIVAVCVERSIDLTVACLGVLKAGAAYLPLDPAYPPDRLAFMLDDAGAPMLVTNRRVADGVPAHDGCTVKLDADWPAIAREASNQPSCLVRADDLAYVIYTSGSTGRPKGVAVTHGSLGNLVAWHLATYALAPSDRSTQLASLGFDAAVWEIWPTLAAGATLVLGEASTAASLDELTQFIRSNGITISFLVTPIVNQLLTSRPDELAAIGVRSLLTGGDTLISSPPALPFDLVNHYGPTECTVVATAKIVDADASIGGPIWNTQTYILDEFLNPAPVGVAGELYVGGAGVARGYLGRPALTAERFVASPFGDPGGRLYRTGDRARRTENGNLEFIGRLDSQVKIRGYRVELGEVEAALLTHPQVRQAAVVAKGEGADRRLVAYVESVGDAGISVDVLRTYLRQRLPEYMIPATFALVPSLPMTPHGKVDRRALPEPGAGGNTRPYIAPRTDVERTLAEVWAAALNVDRVGVDDNFFELGGDSLLAIQIVAHASRAGVERRFKDLIEHQTVAELAAAGPGGSLPDGSARPSSPTGRERGRASLRP